MTEEQAEKEWQDWVANRTELDEIIDAICYAARYNHFSEIDKQKRKIEQLIEQAKKGVA